MGDEKGIEGLIERFSDLPDARVEGRTDHDLLDIVVLALCAVMSGAEGWDDIEDWGREREAWLRRYLPLRNGIPGHDTIRRVFETLSPMELELRFEAWMGEVCPAVKGRVIAIDGKALRGIGTRRTRAAGLASGIGLCRRLWADFGPAHLRREIERNHGHRRTAAGLGA